MMNDARPSCADIGSEPWMTAEMSRCDRSDLPKSPVMMPPLLASGTQSEPQT